MTEAMMRIFMAKHGMEVLTKAEGETVIDIALLRGLFVEMRKHRHDCDLDGDEVAFTYLWAGEFKAQTRDMSPEERDSVRYFVSTGDPESEAKVIAVGKTVEEFEAVLPALVGKEYCPVYQRELARCKEDDDVIALHQRYRNQERYKHRLPPNLAKRC